MRNATNVTPHRARPGLRAAPATAAQQLGETVAVGFHMLLSVALPRGCEIGDGSLTPLHAGKSSRTDAASNLRSDFRPPVCVRL